MRVIGGLFVLAALGCGAPQRAPVAVEPAIDAGIDGGIDAASADAGPDVRAAIEARLATVPPIAIGWDQSVSMSREEAATLCEYERRVVHPSVVTARCDDAHEVTIGAGDGACGEDGYADLRALGDACPLTVGALVACELAVREHPCAIRGIGLPECVALDACVEGHRGEVVDWVNAVERVCQRGGCGGR